MLENVLTMLKAWLQPQHYKNYPVVLPYFFLILILVVELYFEKFK